MADEAQARVVMQLVLETKEAERQLDTLEKSRDDMTVKVDADTSAAQAAVDALTVPPEVLRVDADTTAAQTAVDALTVPPEVLRVDADTSAAQAAVDALTVPPEVLRVDADTSAAQVAVDALTVPPDIYVVTADTSAAQAAVGSLSAEAQRSAAQTERAISQVERPLTRQGSLLTRLRGWFVSLTDRARQFGTQGRRSGEQVNRSFSVLGGTGRSLLQTLTSLFAVTRVIAWGRACVSASTETENAFRGLSSILAGQGRDFAAAQGWLQDYVADGLVPLSNAVASYKNLAARGYDDTQIRAVMTALKDSAAYGRQASYTLGDAVMSATEGLKSENSVLVDNAGVTKNVAKMWDDYARSLGTTSASLTQQQKIQAEVNGILTETRFQTGDAAKVAGTFSGQVSQLTANLTQCKAVVGDFLRVAVLPLVSGLNTAVRAATIFLQTIGDALGITSRDYGQTVGASIASGMEQATDQTDALTTSLTAAKAAQDALKAASFDNFNVIGGQETESAETAVPDVQAPVAAAVTGDYTGIASSAGEASDSVDTLREKVKGFAETWLLGWNDIKGKWDEFKENWGIGAADLKAGWDEFWDSWGVGAGIIKGAWDEFWDTWGVGAADIKSGWDEFWDSWGVGVADIKAGWDEFWDTWGVGAADIKAGWDEFWDTWGVGADVLGEKWGGFKSNWTSGAQTIRDKFGDLKDNWVSGTQTIREKWDGLKDNWVSGAQTIGEKWDGFKSNWLTGAQSLRDGIGKVGEKWDGFKSTWATGAQTVREKWNDFKSNWMTGAADVRERIGGLGDKWDGFKSVWTTGVDEIRERLGAFRADWRTGFDDLRDRAGEKWDDVSSRVKAPFEKIGDWFEDKFAGAWERVKGVFSPGGEVFQGIQSGIDETFRNVVNGLIDGINGVLIDPFWSISEALRLIREWSIWLPWTGDWYPFEWLPSFEMPTLPRLAKGGLVSAPTLALVGDNPGASTDPEVVSPLSKLRDMLPEGDTLSAAKLDAVIRLLERLCALVGAIDPCVRLGDKDIYAASERGRRQFQKMRGI